MGKRNQALQGLFCHGSRLVSERTVDFYNSAEYELTHYNKVDAISQLHDNNLLISHKRVTAAIVFIL